MSTDLFLIIVGMFVAAASAYLGSYMVLKRMALVGDAMSHVALPGMAIAISLGISPMFGAFVFLLLGVFLIWYLQESSEVYPEALVGVLFTLSLAVGVLITKEPDLLEALFGKIENVSFLEGIGAITLSITAVILTVFISKGLIMGIISNEIASASGYKVKAVNLIYLLLVAVVVSLGVKFVGTLLTGALVIIPPASAKNLGRGIFSYQILSVLFALVSALVGIVISLLFRLPTGPIVVLVSIVIFIFTYLLKKKF